MAALEASPVPEETRSGLLAGAGLVRGEGAATEAFLAETRSRFDQQAASIGEEINRQIREAFNEAITTIFALLIWVVTAGWLVTLLVPVLPLRSSNDAAVVVAVD